MNNTILAGNTVTNNIILNGELFGGEGGGIYNTGSLTVNYSTISGNTEIIGNIGNIDDGGGIYNSSSEGFANTDTSNLGIVTMSYSTISGNTAGTAGGGIYNSADDYSGTAIYTQLGIVKVIPSRSKFTATFSKAF